MDVDQRHAGAMRGLAQPGVADGGDLHARTAKALDTVAGRTQQQHSAGIGWAVAHHVHRQRLAVLTQHRVRMAVNIQPGSLGGSVELATRLVVALGEAVGR